MISQHPANEQTIRHALPAGTGGLRLVSLMSRIARNGRRWLLNRRELRDLDDNQLRDIGLSRATIDAACRLDLLRETRSSTSRFSP
jgi:uncharacterized protein YjiS (DUF1127 family)